MKMKLFNKKPFRHCDVGGFIVDFYFDEKKAEGNYALIRGKSGEFEIRIGGYSYMYLLAGVEKGELDNLHGYSMIMYYIGSLLFTEQGFADDIMRVINKYSKRLEKKAESEVSKVSKEAEDMEDIFLRESIKRGKVSNKENRRLREEARADAKEVLENENS